VRKENMALHKMDWKWNGMFKAIKDEAFDKAYFLHFFLKDKLPNKGEDIDTLKSIIEGKDNLEFKHI
jgi:hypothetical protein